ncbi:MAG: hypothetical protein AB7R89_15665 [Dehalococcoidia bacterium]
MASDEQRQPSTPPWLWGLIGGAVVSVLIGVLWTSGGAGIALSSHSSPLSCARSAP